MSVIAPTSPWLVSGASGLLGYSLCTLLHKKGVGVTGLYRSHDVTAGTVGRKIDISDLDALDALVRDEAPATIVHAAGLTNVDACEADEVLATALHAAAAGVMATAARELGAKMVYISTDHLWHGSQAMITEDTPPQPINAYARTKLAGEQAVMTANPQSLVVRTNFYGPGRPWRQSFSDWIIRELSQGKKITAFVDSFFTPICLSRLCPMLLELVERGAEGIFNVAGAERVSKFEFSVRLARATGLPEELINKGSIKDAALIAPRPSDMSLSTKKVTAFLGRPMPGLDDCFEEQKLDRVD